jgi:hypothetical protein
MPIATGVISKPRLSLLELREFDEIFRYGYKSGQPLDPPNWRDFKREIGSRNPPELGGWRAEALKNEAKKLHRIDVKIEPQKN